MAFREFSDFIYFILSQKHRNITVNTVFYHGIGYFSIYITYLFI